MRDLSLKLRVYHNLADDYRSLNKITEATDTYKKALALLKGLGDLDNQGDIFWETATAYETAGDWSEAASTPHALSTPTRPQATVLPPPQSA